MKILKNYKKYILLIIFVFLFISGCGKSEENGTIENKGDTTEVVTKLTKSPYVDTIQNSKIISPEALINAFNVDFDLALNTYNKEVLAIPVTIENIQSGKLVFESDENSKEQTIIEGNYAFFTEINNDNNKKNENINRSNLVCSINIQDNYLLEYGKSKGIDEESGQPIPPLVSQYYLVGSIYSVVGNDKYNIIIKDARLFPGTTYFPLDFKENNEENKVVLDISSGENINEKVNQYFWNDTDFDLDGLCDEFVIQTNEYTPDSSFDKLVYNKIYQKINTPLKTVIQLLYKSSKNENKNLSFNINFPLKISEVSLNKTAAFDGNILNLVKFDLIGLEKKQIDYLNKKDILDETFKEFKTNTFFMENQVALCQANKSGINTFKIKLLDGRETESINSDIVFMKNISIDNVGTITGDIYVKAIYPFEYYYKTDLRIMSNQIISEVPNDNYIFYSIQNFENLGEFKTSHEIKEYNMLGKIDIPVSVEKIKFSQFEITNENNEIKTGYGIYKANDMEKKVNIFKTLGQKFAIIDITKDEEEDFYWIYIANDKLKGYIPVSLDNYFTYNKTNINILTKLSDTSYSFKDLFDILE